jgi:hypothetical protein
MDQCQWEEATDSSLKLELFTNNSYHATTRHAGNGVNSMSVYNSGPQKGYFYMKTGMNRCRICGVYTPHRLDKASFEKLAQHVPEIRTSLPMLSNMLSLM